MRISDWSSDVCSSDLSDRACLSIRFEHPVRRPALKSANSGWCAYPVCIEASLVGDQFLLEFGTEVVRSEARRVGKSVSVSVDLGGRRSIKKKMYTLMKDGNRRRLPTSPYDDTD